MGSADSEDGETTPAEDSAMRRRPPSNGMVGVVVQDHPGSQRPSRESAAPNGDEEQQRSSHARPRGLKRSVEETTDKTDDRDDVDREIAATKKIASKPATDQRKMKAEVPSASEVEPNSGSVERDASIGNEVDVGEDGRDETHPDAYKYNYYGPASLMMDTVNEDDVVLPDDNENPFYALPEGVHVEWNKDNTSATLSMALDSPEQGVTINNRPAPRVCVVGRAQIRVLQGSLEVLGHIMTPYSEPTTICSPYWSSWLTLTFLSVPCRAVLTTTTAMARKLCRPSFRVLAPTRPIVVPPSWETCVDEMVQACTSLLSPMPAPTDAMKKDTVMFRPALEDHDDDCNDQPHQDLNIGPRSIFMITGAKGVGKSTLLRYMTNRLLSRGMSGIETSNRQQYGYVAILDADVGQPELAPPGLLRLAIVKRPLLHPPYWNLAGIDEEKETTNHDNHVTTPSNSQFEIVSSVFFGAITSKADPTRYINAVQFLMEEYQKKVLPNQNIPLLINLDGWVKGMGYQILNSLIHSLNPTHVCQILGEARAQTFELVLPEQEENSNISPTPKIFVLQACTDMPEASLCSIPSVAWRNFRWTTYFLPPVAPQGESQTTNRDDRSRILMMDALEGWNFLSAKDLQTGWISVSNAASSRPPRDEDEAEVVDECRMACALAREKPYCVPMEAVECSLIGSDFQDFLWLNDCKDRILQALNGSIVSLCTNTITNESLGYGILRSIDWNQRLLYVLVPPTVSAESLTRTTALVGGNLPLPLPLLFRGVYAESFPYLTTLDQKNDCDGERNVILGSEPMKSRNNINRRSMINARANP